MTITPTKKKRRSDTSKMTISGMKDNPYGFGEPIDQPALSLSVSYLYYSEIHICTVRLPFATKFLRAWKMLINLHFELNQTLNPF